MNGLGDFSERHFRLLRSQGMKSPDTSKFPRFSLSNHGKARLVGGKSTSAIVRAELRASVFSLDPVFNHGIERECTIEEFSRSDRTTTGRQMRVL